jgi:integrase
LNCRIDVRRADELRWFWKATGELPEPYGTVLRLLLLTGARRDEIARLTTDEISDDLATLRLPGERTKNHRPHEIYLPPLAVTLLTSVKRIAGKFVFGGIAPVTSWSRMKRVLDAAMAKLAKQERGEDFTIPPFRIHDVRRTAATGMHAIGIPPHIVEAVIGHVSGFKSGVAGVYNVANYESERRWRAGPLTSSPSSMAPRPAPWSLLSHINVSVSYDLNVDWQVAEVLKVTCFPTTEEKSTWCDRTRACPEWLNCVCDADR